MSEGEFLFYVFCGILASPLIALWALIAGITYVCTGGQLGWDWWEKLWEQVEAKMSGRFCASLVFFVLALDVLLVAGGFTRYRMNNNTRLGEEVTLAWRDFEGKKMVLEKDLVSNIWRWNYGSDVVKVQQMCPTFGRNHDAVVKVNGQVQASTDAYWLSNLYKYDIIDHDGRKVYTVMATSGKAIIEEYFGLALSVVVLDLEGQPVAYVEGESFIVDEFVMRDRTGEAILTFIRNIETLDAWKWEITAVAQNADVVFKPVYAAVLAGHHAFADPNIFVGRKDTDVCNWWFQIAFIFVVIGACILPVSFLSGMFFLFRDWNRKEEQKTVTVLNEPDYYAVTAKQYPQMTDVKVV